MKNIQQTLKSLIIALILVGGISYVFAWSGPSTTPPNGNVDAPINVGSSGQTKSSYFAATQLLSSIDITSPRYCIGTDCITSWASVGGGTPSGAVMAFDMDTCPSGWTAYAAANGRQIIGVGNSGTAGSVNHTRGSTGGEEKHTQTIAEMPSHSHISPIGEKSNSFYWGNSTMTNQYGTSADEDWDNNLPNTSSTGGGQSFNIMDPYITLLYCKKN